MSFLTSRRIVAIKKGNLNNEILHSLTNSGSVDDLNAPKLILRYGLKTILCGMSVYLFKNPGYRVGDGPVKIKQDCFLFHRVIIMYFMPYLLSLDTLLTTYLYHIVPRFSFLTLFFFLSLSGAL